MATPFTRACAAISKASLVLAVVESGSHSPMAGAWQAPDQASPRGMGGILFPVAWGARSTG